MSDRSFPLLRRIEERFPGASKFVGKRLLICGSRSFYNRTSISLTIYCFEPSALINGCAPGADTIANEEFRKIGKEPEEYPADWDGLGIGAGCIRNTQMLEEGKPDIVIAFYSGRRTHGTQDMVDKARDAGVFVVELGLTEEE